MSDSMKLTVVERAEPARALRVLQPEQLSRLQRIELEQQVELAQAALEIAERAVRRAYALADPDAKDSLVTVGTYTRRALHSLPGALW